ncbi:MAG: glycosyltransferase family 4 protein [Candidatus Eremiobacteraeota bacterium]|nr:glycosyltransferase family 4 protein [Candidatus Eremiobacteraeota bacterium]MBC5827438.1 glycosyltransferase family 4 protein [Candidatus Eremiobacteraeota bacterium]
MQATTLSKVLTRSSWGGVGRPRALFVGTYPPRECGIATFTEDVRAAYDVSTGFSSDVIAITDRERTYDYPPCVVSEIQRDHSGTYLAAARFANDHPADVINVQHEYGLFGGQLGLMLVDFLGQLRKPVTLTLHTTLPNPDEKMLYVTRELCNRSDSIIVLAETGRRLLEQTYRIDPRKVRVVLHGAPDVPLRRSYRFKRLIGLENRTVISTFGLLSRGKGIEYILDALPAIFAEHTDAEYLLLGQTHPEVLAQEGEAYRKSLRDRVDELGIGERVRFINHYMSDDEVVRWLLATDVYVSPSLDANQIVSGTLSYAVACGRAVVATRYLYAQEILADGRGITVPFRDSAALSKAVNSILEDPELRSSIETSAYRFGRQMTWTRVAHEYEQGFLDAVHRRSGPALLARSEVHFAAKSLLQEARGPAASLADMGLRRN